MKSLTATAAIALTAGIIGLGALTPAAFAQQQPPGGMMQPHPGQFGDGDGMNHGGKYGQGQGMNHHGGQLMNGGQGMNQGQGRGGMAMLDLVCSPNGAERLEIAFVRLSHRVTLTDAQKPLFDDLKSTALTAQTQFADACTAARPAATANQPAMPDPVARLKAGLGLEKAKIAALETVLPKFEAFFNSLSDEQKQAMAPRMGRGQPGPGMMPPPAGQQPGMDQPGAAPAPAQPQG